jgi:3-phosphoshikimate 1-carboxyvinyltransferase
MNQRAIEPITTPFSASFAPPGSKSLTNRALVLAALGDGTSTLSNILLADDTHVMLDNLSRLGFHLEIDRDERIVHVHGGAGEIPSAGTELFCGNSGTTIRFLTALCTLATGAKSFTLDGIARMRQRPIAPLIDMLKNLGGRVEFLMEPGYPPVRVLADGLPGGVTRYGSETSSQYLSAVLMVGPYTRNELNVHLEGRQTSWPYVAMTMRLMDTFGVTPELIRDPDSGEPKQIIIPPGKYAGTEYVIEPDASNAGYFLAAAAIHPGSKLTIEGLGRQSLQGDVGFADLLHRMGADLVFGRDFVTVMGTDRLEGIEANLLDMPDTAQTLAVVALFARGTTVIRGLHTLRVKETDRLRALATELARLGADVDVQDDALTIDPPEDARLKPAAIDTYDDHRMAMSFALAGTRSPGVRINDPECVNKTYPQFFEDLERVIRSTGT